MQLDLLGHRVGVALSLRDALVERGQGGLFGPLLGLGLRLHLLALPLQVGAEQGVGAAGVGLAVVGQGHQGLTGLDVLPVLDQYALDQSCFHGHDLGDAITRLDGALHALFLGVRAKDQPQDLSADVVVANILAGPLKELAEPITALLKPQAQLGLSGILANQAQAVCEAYQTQAEVKVRLDPVAEKEEWCRITGVKLS